MAKIEKKYSVAAIITYKKKYLFQKRDKKGGIFYPNLYGLFGGNNKDKEFPKKTIKRELSEEINLEFKKIKYFLTIKIESDHFNPKNSSIFKRYFFLCELPHNLINKLKLQEGQSYKFFDINKVNAKNFVPFDYAAARYHQMIHLGKKVSPKRFLKD